MYNKASFFLTPKGYILLAEWPAPPPPEWPAPPPLEWPALPPPA